MTDEEKAKIVKVHALHSSAIMEQCPDYVSLAFQKWIRDLQDKKVSAKGWSENVTVSDVAMMELKNERDN